jgi:hypothetical protein
MLEKIDIKLPVIACFSNYIGSLIVCVETEKWYNSEID